jgi:hypothetical protein
MKREMMKVSCDEMNFMGMKHIYIVSIIEDFSWDEMSF